MRYAYSLNGENYVGNFLKREEALAAGLEAAGQSLDQPQTIFVGRRVEANTYAGGHARTVLREMAWQAHDEVGSPAASYLNQLGDQQIAELDQQLEKTLLDWMQRHDLLPKYFKVEGVSEHPVPAPSVQFKESRETDEISQSLGQPQ